MSSKKKAHFHYIPNNANYTPWAHTLPNYFYGLRNVFGSSKPYIIQVRRESDDAVADVLMPPPGEWISSNSLLSIGGTLASFANNIPIRIQGYYDHVGNKNCFHTVPTGNNSLSLGTGNALYLGYSGFPSTYNDGYSSGHVNRASGLNGGVNLTEFSLLFVWNPLSSTSLNNRPLSFGNSADGDSTSAKIQFVPSADNTIRCFGASEPALVPPTLGPKIDTCILASNNNRTRYSNGVKICDSANGNPPVDDFYIPYNSGGQQLLAFTEVFVFLTNISAERAAMEATVNATFNYY